MAVTVVRAHCTECGDVSMTTRDVTVRVCEDHPGLSTFRFTCPKCRRVNVRSDKHRTCELLEAAGVAVERWQLPEELWEPRSGDPISHDDLLNFHDKLDAEIEGILGGSDS